jgi:hypothetical protein
MAPSRFPSGLSSHARPGHPQWGKYSLIKLPSESVLWSLAYLDTEDCRVYGAIVPLARRKPTCAKFASAPRRPWARGSASASLVVTISRGAPHSDHCCEKYPNAIYCKPAPTTGDKALEKPVTP